MPDLAIDATVRPDDQGGHFRSHAIMFSRRQAVLGGAAASICGASLTIAHEAGDPATEVSRIEQRLVGPDGAGTLAERMAHHKVPGLSVTFFTDEGIGWSRAYGLRDASRSRPATTETVFQAGSISKPVAAITALKLVEAGHLDLEADVRSKLRAWGVDDGVAATGDVVTMGDLLNHSAGLNIHGFLGYFAGSKIPSLDEVIMAAQDANNAPLHFAHRPRSQWDYSGGGYSVAQKLMCEAAGQTFDDLSKHHVLNTLGMASSTYARFLPPSLASRAALPHDASGMLLPEGAHIFPEQNCSRPVDHLRGPGTLLSRRHERV